jgi:ribosomal protein L11 methyltransferase
MDYLELNISVSPREPWTEIITAQLAEFSFDSFVETEDGVQAYAPNGSVDIELLKTETLLGGESSEVKVTFSEKIIPHQNWNEKWESDFQPVKVEEYLTILAPFHDKKDASGMVVEIQPQMSFGTGHHETTWLMSKSLFDLEKVADNVLDMGTGTGVLAIIAEKLGAKSVLAIDIEPWSVENTIENVSRNNCISIESLCGDIDLIEGREFGLILANINKNVLKSHLEFYSKTLIKDGVLFLSGFFDSDVEELVTYSSQYNLREEKVISKDSWACIKLVKE